MRTLKINGKERRLPKDWRKQAAKNCDVSRSTVSKVVVGIRPDFHGIGDAIIKIANEFEQSLKKAHEIERKV